ERAGNRHCPARPRHIATLGRRGLCKRQSRAERNADREVGGEAAKPCERRHRLCPRLPRLILHDGASGNTLLQWPDLLHLPTCGKPAAICRPETTPLRKKLRAATPCSPSRRAASAAWRTPSPGSLAGRDARRRG